jgi:hypothetical protein
MVDLNVSPYRRERRIERSGDRQNSGLFTKGDKAWCCQDRDVARSMSDGSVRLTDLERYLTAGSGG